MLRGISPIVQSYLLGHLVFSFEDPGGRGDVDPYRTSCVVGGHQIVFTSGTSAVYLSAGFPTVLNWYSYLLSV